MKFKEKFDKKEKEDDDLDCALERALNKFPKAFRDRVFTMIHDIDSSLEHFPEED